MWFSNDEIKSYKRKNSSRVHHVSIAEHQKLEQTLESCVYCIDSRKFQKHLIVALGLKVCKLPWTKWIAGENLSFCIDLSLYITYWAVGRVTMCDSAHVARFQLSADGRRHFRWNEGERHTKCSRQNCSHVRYKSMLQIWRKGLVAMCKERDLDVIFVEVAKNVQHQPHTRVEAYPVPQHIGDTAPMYFKVCVFRSPALWLVAQERTVLESHFGVRGGMGAKQEGDQLARQRAATGSELLRRVIHVSELTIVFTGSARLFLLCRGLWSAAGLRTHHRERGAFSDPLCQGGDRGHARPAPGALASPRPAERDWADRARRRPQARLATLRLDRAGQTHDRCRCLIFLVL